MVQGPEHQHRVVRRVILSEAASVPQLDRERPVAALRGGACLFHVKGLRVHQMNLVALVGEPGRVGPGTAANVEDGCRGGRKEALEQLLGPDELDA